jgi:PqqD family protein of HPr-rel-A system
MIIEDTPAVRRWRATEASATLWAEWDGEYVAYHAPSGRTHLLNAASALLIREVLREPRSGIDAATELAGLQGTTADEEFVDSVASLLLRLDETGLIEAA